MKQDMYTWGNWWTPIYATQFSRKEAVQQTTWCNGKLTADADTCVLYVTNTSGRYKIYEGDWIIKVNGQFYAVDEEIFDQTFTKWDARAGGNTDLQEWPQAPTQLTQKRKEKTGHGPKIRSKR